MSQPAAHLTLGVIGHVDHGKTALVRALTGIETDRLAEERERGLSIVLGFAHLERAGTTIDLVDVPGHEAFIRAMIAGATGLDGVLLVVAANEGVQPQTREHFAIARLLDLRTGVVVITKADLADTASLDSVRREIAALVSGTFLESAAVVAVSALREDGIDQLKRAMAELPHAERDSADTAPFCLPLDRVFTMRGFGVVGTGTVRSGRIATGADVEILPHGLRAAVRGLQRHGRAVETAATGQRVAINLRGVDRDQLERGDVVATLGALSPTTRIDAALELLPDVSGPIKNGAQLRALIGTTDVAIKLRLLEGRELEPGASALAQLRCATPIVCQRGERFILRVDTPSQTVGGGRVIEPHAPRRRRFDESVIQALRQAGSASAAQRVAQILEAADMAGATVEEIRAQAGVDAAALRRAAEAIEASWIGDGRLMTGAAAARVLETVRRAVQTYHAEHPLRLGMSMSELASSVTETVGAEALKWALTRLREAGKLAGSADRVHVAGFDPLARLSDAERKLAVGLASQYLRMGVEPPGLNEITTRGHALQAIVNLLFETGQLVKLQTTDRKRPMALHADVLQDVKERLAKSYPYPAQFAVKDARDLLKSTRKFVLPILEHLDATGFTLRRGDYRQLRIERNA